MKLIELDVLNEKQVHNFSIDGACQIYFKNGKAYISLPACGSKHHHKPMHKHDCADCIFLYTREDTYDLYFCPRESAFPTVIARYGDEGSEYMSGLGSSISVLAEAEQFCKRIGLLPINRKESAC